MKKASLLLIVLSLSLPIKAQIHELGFFLGGSNTIADIGATKSVFANSPAIGLVYKWNITTRYAIRSSFMNSNLKSYDFYAQDLSRFNRLVSIDNNVFEFSLGFEVNFLEFNLHDDDKELSPYIFAGVNYFHQELYKIAPRMGNSSMYDVSKYDGEFNFSIPIVIGIKASISPLFIVGIETGIRYALSDNIDGSNPVGEFANDPTLKHGNLYNNDWYVFTGLTFSYTFGQIPCYCKEK
jgi:hypothetical protein